MEHVKARISALKKNLNAVILVHNYCSSEVQTVGDYVGDSLGLAVKASETDADVIVFCGVTFMAETAKILNPGKTVLIPEKEAVCSMAHMCSAEQLANFKERHPGVVAVGYVNSTASTKRLLDVCCTSSNAVDVVSRIDSRDIIFVPDKNLGSYVASKCPEKNVMLWNGFCPMHHSVTARNVRNLKAKYPSAPVIAHPECRSEVLQLADSVGSTERMISFSRDSDAEDIIVLTEVGMKARLEREVPGKRFHFVDTIVCSAMKMINLDSIVDSMEGMLHRIELDEDTIREAGVPVRRMLE